MLLKQMPGMKKYLNSLPVGENNDRMFKEPILSKHQGENKASVAETL
jgi:hypothetical protein